MKIACSSQTFDQPILNGDMTLQQFYEFCSSVDFIDGVELEDKHISRPQDDDYLEHIVQLGKQYGLPIINFAYDCNFGYASQEKLDAELTRVQEWLKVAKILEITRFRLFAGWPDTDKVKQWPRMIEYVTKAAALVKEAGMIAVIENHNHGGFLSDSDDVVRMFQDLGPGVASLLLDTGNYVDGLPGVLRTAKWSRHVHAKVKEIDGTGKPETIDYPPMLKELADTGYKGWLSIEYEGESEPKQVVRSFGAFLQHHLNLLAN